jgi:hypothetical protein
MNERSQPFGRMGIGRMIERAGEAAGLPFPVHVHMLRHSTGYALAARGMDTRRLQHFLGHAAITNTVRYTAMSPEPFKNIWRSSRRPAGRTRLRPWLRCSASEEPITFLIDDVAKTVTFSDGRRLRVSRFDKSWISATWTEPLCPAFSVIMTLVVMQSN